MIECVGEGVVYVNPHPHLRSRHAWHPSVVALSANEWFVSFDLGEAVESLDYATWTTTSNDAGDHWTAPQRLLVDPWLATCLNPAGAVIPCTHSIRVGRMADGEWVGIGARWQRPDPEQGLVNRTNLGYTAMDLFLTRRDSAGETWSAPCPLTSPLPGPGFELCHPVMECPDGRWLWPTSTWRGWDGQCPLGMQAVAWVSTDRGRTWPAWIPLADESSRQVILWEVGVTHMPGNQLLASVWRFHEPSGRSLPSAYFHGTPTGSFTKLRENGLAGETAKVLGLRDGRVVCVYRGCDRPGMWAQLADLRDGTWHNLAETAVWQGAGNAMRGRQHASDELSSLRCGYPSLVELSQGEVLVVFWCREDCLHVIRWSRLRVTA